MAKLIHYNGDATPFRSINSGSINDLPIELREAARLILEWFEGNGFYSIHTSGSTGKPKNITLEQDKIEYSALQTANAFGLVPGDTLLCCLGLNYIAGFMMVMRAVVNDCNLVMAQQVSNPLSGLAEGLKIDFSSFVPLQMETMLKDPDAIKIMNKMKAILIGGGPVSESLEEKLQILTVPVFHTYSMTETYTHVAIRQVNGEIKQRSYYPLPGVRISLDERGCIVINSFLTNNKPLVTNDFAEILPDSSFVLIGRADNVINSGGVKIQLEKVESICGQVFTSFGMNPIFFATGLKDEKLGEKLVLVIEGEALEAEMINNFNNQLSTLMGKYEMPKKIIFVKKIALTKTGKIDRRGTMENFH